MSKPAHRSFASRTLHRMRQLWQGRRRKLERQDRRAAFLFEPLESRHLMAGDLDLGEGEGTAPTLAELPDIVLNAGSPQWVPLDGFDVDGGTLTYTVTSSNPSLVQGTVPTGNKSLKMSVAGFGDMYFQLFEHLTPRVTNRIIQLVESGFYDDTATNTITFHRILNDFVIQAGDPTGTGSGGSTLGDFDDQFHVDLQHNRSGLLSMAKSSDDTNDSQFFITEEKNESQQITLVGSPTGGTFTLTYFNQTTAPIAFNSNGDFTAMAASIKSALESLSLIGAGNVNVTHDPVRNESNQITDNRRWKVEFINELGHQEVVNLTGNASGLTGGANRSISVVESKSARHLDFNHSIFGILTQGESVRDAISNVTTNAQGTPTNPPVISNVDVIVDPENGALLLKAAEGASGESNITVRVTDAEGNFFERTFSVIVTPDGFNGAPFLNDIAPIQATAGQPVQLQLSAQDAEGNAFFFDAVKPTGNTVNYTLNVNNNTGLVTITPPVGFSGSFQVLVAVRGTTTTDTGDQFDRQLVTVNVGATAPTAINLLAVSDTGFSDTDNITNASSLQFQISGVTSGAVVKLKKGTEVIAQGTAAGTSITLTVNNSSTTLGEGTHTLTATQTIGSSQESAASPALDVTLDTTAPGAFTTTPPTEASVGLPLVYDATAPGEGSAGFVYTLGSAPAGAQISGVTGELIWTPAENQVGSHVFQIIATDPAGNSTSQTVNLTVGEPLEAELLITLVLVDADENPLTSLGVGQDFFLQIFVQDVSNDPQGVFSAYLDVLFDALKAEATGPIVFGSNYQLFQSGTTSTAGLINEVGAVGPLTTPTGSGVTELARIPMRAKQAGLLTFTADPADDLANHITALYGEEGSVDFAAIRFGTASIEVETTFLTVNDTFNVDEDSQNQSLNPLANDEIEAGSGDVLTIDSVGTPSNGGTVTISTDGKTLIYTPAANFFGTETFTYTAENQDGAKSTATITVQVAPKNDPPTANDDTFNVPEDSTNFALDVLSNDSSTPDGPETLKVTAVTQPTSGGTVAVGPSGNSVTITPANNFIGTLTFTYTMSDGNGGTDTATVTVTVTEANDPPVAANDTATVSEDSTGNIINVLANDTSGPDVGETLTVTAVSAGSNGGTITVGTGGANVVYAPKANFQGIETFTYTISDGRGGTATATVTVTVTNANNDPPTANNDTLTAFKNTPAELNVLANDTSAPDPTEVLTIDSVTQPANGTVTISANGTRITYTPNNNFTGTDTFTYKIKDPGGAVSESATVTVNVQEFIPSSLAGFVYFDVDNDGQKDAGESPITGVTLTLTGTDVNSAAVNRTVVTGDDGSYKFDNLAPGNYTITETQPGILVDGKEQVGSQGGTSTTNDKIVVTVASGTNGTGNNFGEQGRPASMITLADFYARNSRDYVLAAINGSGAELWHSTRGDAFDAYTNLKVTLLSGGTQVKIEGTNAQSQPVSATISINDPRVRILGTSGTSQLLKITAFNLDNPSNNSPPTAVADTYAATEDTVLTVTAANGVLKNDTDPNAGTTLTAVIATQPTKGTLTLNANGSFTYTPQANANGTDTFTYRASDGTAQSSPVTVTINIAAVNDAPTAVNNSYTATRDTPLVVNQANGVLANDTDPDTGTTLTATIVAQPQHGTVTLNSNGSFTYTPTAGYTGPDSFTYRASDGTLQSGIATVNLTVQAPNQAPTAVADSYATNEDTPLTVAAAQGVLANDTDPQAGTTLTAVVVTQPAQGTLTLNNDGSFTYTPAANFSGTATFTYRASDGSLQSEPVTVTITVNPINDAPTAVNDAYSIGEDATLTVPVATGLLDNDSDPDTGATLTAEAVTQPENGTLTLNGDGSFSYVPDPNFHGTDTFTYRVSDGTVTSNTATVTITVEPVNDAPVAAADSFATPVNTTLTIAVPGVLTNDTDADDNPLTAAVVNDVEHGTLTLNANGSFTYIPDEDFTGTDSFTYQVSDGTAQSDPVTVTITVSAAAPPTAASDSYSVGEDSTLTVDAATGVLDNDTGSSTLTALLVAEPEHGTLTLNSDGSFSYVPDPNFHGTDTFTYRASDGSSQSEVTTVTITVNPVNDAPTGTADAYTTTINTQLTIAAPGVLANDTDVDGNPLSAAVAAAPAQGALTLNLDGSFTYIPAEDFDGDVTFTYTVTDGVLTSDPITVTITVEAENTAPVAVNDTYSIDEDSVLTVDVATGVLDNDTDAEGDTLSTVIVAEPAHGTLVLNANGSFTYTPDDDFAGSDTFTYRASDGSLESAVATVTITVNPVNDAPSPAADAYQVEQDSTLTIDAAAGVLANDTDADGDTLTVNTTPVVDPEHGTVTLNADGSFTYTPDAGYIGSDSFTYEVTDGTLTSQAVVTITVEEPNVAPASVNDQYNATEDLPLAATAELGVLANDSDANSDDLTVTLIADVQHGTLELNADGSFSYIPNPDFHGTDGFSYRASDGSLQSEVAAVTIFVTAVNDAPLAVADAFTVQQNGSLSITAPGLLENDTDVDGDTLSVVTTAVVEPEHGTLTLQTDGSFVYTPDADFFGTDSFTYQITDGTLTAQAVVTITVEEAGEGEASPLDDALLAYLSGLEDEESLAAEDDHWEAAIDETLAALA